MAELRRRQGVTPGSPTQDIVDWVAPTCKKGVDEGRAPVTEITPSVTDSPPRVTGVDRVDR